MADVQKTIEIVFGAVDNTGSALTAISGHISSFAGGVKDATQPLADLTDKVLKVDAAIAALGVTMIAWAVNSAGKFSDQTNEIYTLFEATAPKFDDFKDSVKDYASQSSASIDEINAALYQAVSAGVAYGDSVEFVRKAELSSVAGKASLNDAVTLLAGTMNAYGASVDEVSRYQDAFQQTVKDGITTFPALVQSMGQVTPLAAAMKVPIETLGAAIATMTASGIQTPQAMTAMTAALTALTKPSEQAKELAKNLSIEFNAAAVQSKGFETVLYDVAKATGGNQEQMATLFGSVEAVKGVLALTKDGASAFRDELLKFAQDTGAVADAYAKMKDNFALTNQNIINNMQLTLIAMGEPLLKGYGDIGKDISAIFRGISTEFSTEGGAFDPIIAAVQSLSANLESTLSAMAQNLPAAFDKLDFGPIITSFGRLGETLSGIFGGVNLSTVDGLASAMQSVINASGILIDVTNGIAKSFAPVIEQITEGVKWYAALDSGTQESIGQVLGWGKVVNVAATAIEPLAISIGGLALAFPALKAAMTGVGALFTGAFAELTALAAAYLAVKYGVEQNIAAYQKYRATVDANADATEHIADVTERSAAALDKINERLGTSYKTMAEFNKATEDGTLIFNKTTSQWELAAASIDKTTAATKDVTEATKARNEAGWLTVDQFEQSLRAEEQLTEAIKQDEENQKRSTDATKDATDAKRGYSAVIDEATGKVIGYTQAGSAFVSKEKEKKDALDKSVEKLAEYKTKMEQIASDERIKSLELAVKLDIARLETDTKRVEAAFQSIDNSITSTGDLLGSLFGDLTSASGLDKIEIQDQIDKENELRQQSFELQKELTEAEIARIKKQTEALDRGDATIQIDGTGLEPELEAFMWAILKKIRVRANAEFQDYLLGMEA